MLLHRGHADNGVRLDDLRVERKAEPAGIDVEYTGPKLAPATHYDWYVDVQTKRGWVSARSGAGTETYEFVVPAALATDDRVRVKFENQDDPAFYDPSIADVWAYRLD